MTLESDCRSVVETFLADFGDGQFTLLADGARWTVMGSTPISGTKDKETMRAELGGFIRSAVEGRFTMELVSMIVEGDRAAVRCRSHARLRAGGVYENDYHNLYTVRDGRIVEIIEYLDTAFVEKFFGALAP